MSIPNVNIDDQPVTPATPATDNVSGSSVVIANNPPSLPAYIAYHNYQIPSNQPDFSPINPFVHQNQPPSENSFGPPEILPAEITFDEQRDKIGQGSYGTVYVARCRDQEVVVKKPNVQQLNEADLRSFQEEVIKRSKLSHPNVIRLMGACTTNGHLLIVTEKCVGDLNTLLQDVSYQGNLYDRLKLARDTAKGMTWLHDNGIIHGDLKPANLLVDAAGQIKINNVEFSQFMPSHTTRGTLIWMAPEKMLGKPFTEKVDVFNFGIILWEIVTRQKPYPNHSDPTAFCQAVCYNNERPPLTPDISPALRDLMACCWHHEPTTRYSFREILHRLNSIMVDTVITMPIAASFWKRKFLSSENFEYIDVLTFLHALHQEVGVADLSFYDEIMHYLIEEVTEGAKKQQVVKMARFDKVSKWFGPFFVGEVGPAIINEIKTLALQPWFHGDISGDVANQRLSDKPRGTFLIRLSSTDPFQAPFSLSLTNNLHIQMLRTQEGLRVQSDVYSSLDHFVAKNSNTLKFACSQELIEKPRWPTPKSIEVDTAYSTTEPPVAPRPSLFTNVLIPPKPHEATTKGPPPPPQHTLFSDASIPPKPHEATTKGPPPPHSSHFTNTNIPPKPHEATTKGSPPPRTHAITESTEVLLTQFQLGPLEIAAEDIELGSVIGNKGAYGGVYKGRCGDTLVAVKIPKEQNLDAAALEDFKKEVELLSLNNHPNVVRLLGACTVPGKLRIVTELCRGDVESLLDDPSYNGSLYDRLKMGRDTAIGMIWLHRLTGTIHGDLKTANLLVDDHLQVKISDFGFGVLKKNVVINPATVRGSIMWMAPEKMVKGVRVTEKIDVYSFGIILWELVNRKRPYNADNYASVPHFCHLVCNMNERPQPTPGTRADLQTLMEDCWHRDPEQRCSFREILSRLNLIMIDCVLTTPSAAQFWKTKIIGSGFHELVEHVEWNAFERALTAEIGPVSDLSHFKNLIVEQAVIVGKKSEIVTMSRFNQIEKWFGPFYLPVEGPIVIEEMTTLMQKSWFHGHISKELAETKLRGREKEGSFLIRLSNTQPGYPFTLSTPKGHVKLQRQANGIVAQDTFYPSLSNFVEVNKNKLRTACPKELPPSQNKDNF